MKVIKTIKTIFFAILFTMFFTLANNVHAESINFGLGKRDSNQIPAVPDKYKKMFAENKTYYMGDSNSKKIYLTFDSGYENGTMPSILDTLKELDVHACFFVTGHYIKAEKDLILRMKEEGHIIANHSNKHKNFTKIAKEQILEELVSLEKLYYDLTNEEMIKIMRVPAGVFNEEVLTYTSGLGYTNLFWSVAYEDWDKNKFVGNHHAFNKVVPKVHNGAIILLHPVSKDNQVDLKDIIIELQVQGYIFSSVKDFQ